MTVTETRPSSAPGSQPAPNPGQRVIALPAKIAKSPHFARVLFPIAMFAVWEFSLIAVEEIWPFAVDVLPTPSEVGAFMWDEFITDTLARKNLYETFFISLRRLMSGFAIAMVLGTALGLAMGLSRATNAFCHDWTMAILAMPARGLGTVQQHHLRLR